MTMTRTRRFRVEGHPGHARASKLQGVQPEQKPFQGQFQRRGRRPRLLIAEKARPDEMDQVFCNPFCTDRNHEAGFDRLAVLLSCLPASTLRTFEAT